MSDIIQEKKNQIVTRIRSNTGDSNSRLMLDLLDVMIQEKREENDDARGETAVLNQGFIQGLKTLKMYLTINKKQESS